MIASNKSDFLTYLGSVKFGGATTLKLHTTHSAFLVYKISKIRTFNMKDTKLQQIRDKKLTTWIQESQSHL